MIRILGVVLALTLLGTPAAQAQLPDTPATKQLYEAAKKEGSVMIWGPLARSLEWLTKEFPLAYPGIEVKFVGDQDLAVKAIAEARAGRHEVDVFHSSLGGTIPVIQRDLLAQIDWAAYGVKRDSIVFDGKAILTNNIVYAVTYDTNKVKPEDLPRSWTDILDPKYKGKMAGSSFLVPRLIGFLGLEWGEEKAMKFARDLVGTTDILITRQPAIDFIRTGERQYTIGDFEAGARYWQSQKMAVDYIIPEPVAAVQFLNAVMAKAPRPNAARLLAVWMTTPNGKRLREKYVFEADYREGTEHEVAKKIQANGVKLIFESEANMVPREELYKKVTPIISGQVR
jgi:iron(III) transport system substrate-binding protein